MVRFVYNLLFPAVFLFFLPPMIVKLIKRAGWKSTFGERFALFSKHRRTELNDWKGAIWLHAVSVGETNVALSLLKKWEENSPNQKFILSTTTTTAQQIAREKVSSNVKVVFAPLDYWPIVSRTLNVLKPSKLIIFETELWPELIWATRKRNIRLFLVNTRISDHSYKGYYRFRFIFAPLLENFNLICAQTQLDYDRLVNIAPNLKEKIKICGNIKFDQEPLKAPGFNYAEIFGDGMKVVLAASTHAPEESFILDVYQKIHSKFQNVRLVLVPRHAERGDEIEGILKDKGISYHRRSKNTGKTDGYDVLLADTTGELASFTKTADVVLIGKSFCGNTEGQSIIEPAILGKAIICGKQLKNFRQALDVLVRNNAVVRLNQDDELEDALQNILRDDDRRMNLGIIAARTMRNNKGATNLILNNILSVN